MSQYMNEATRVKGWTATDTLLDTWADKFNAQLRIHTDRIEQQKTQQKDAKSPDHPVAEYAQSNVIRESDESNYEDNAWSAGSTSEVDTYCYEVDENLSSGWGSVDQWSIYNEINSDAENLAICSATSGDWGNYDIQHVFYSQPTHQYVYIYLIALLNLYICVNKSNYGLLFSERSENELMIKLL